MTPGRRAELLGDLDRPRAWMLLVDGVPQSHVDLDDPRHLELEYVRRIGHLLDLAAPERAPLRVLHVGGGALTLARYVAATRPGSAQLAAEPDADVVALVRQRLPLDQPPRSRARAGRITVRETDGRAVVEQAAAGSCDVIILDAFAGARTPAHLTSAEFTAAVARALRPSGCFAANIADGPPLSHARRRMATLAAAFAHVCLVAEPGVLRGRRFGNLIGIASAADLPLAQLTRRAAGDPFPARVVDGDAMARFTAGARPITDADAEPSPVPPPGAFA